MVFVERSKCIPDEAEFTTSGLAYTLDGSWGIIHPDRACAA